ncbi:MAG: hypothetical protein IMZ61_16350, partial [Planctomycetes bacterium]|nr:hypothetical protein [Planctomycetota bacterium]
MKRQLTSIASEIRQARLRLKKVIDSLPDSADGIKMLGSNYAMVPLSTIAQHGFNLSPRYYLTRETKTQLKELVDTNRNIETLITSIEAILATRKLKDGTKLPPNIIE